MGKRAAAVLLVVLQAEVLVVAGVGTLQQVVLYALGAQLGRAARRRDRQDQSGHPGALSAEVLLSPVYRRQSYNLVLAIICLVI